MYKAYKCKACEHQYTRIVGKASQKEACPNCRTVNAPYRKPSNKKKNEKNKKK